MYPCRRRADLRRDTPSAATGSPTIVIPAGVDAHGQPINIQLLGRAWDDAKLVGFAYAFEQIANAAGRGHVRPETVPPLRYDPAMPVRPEEIATAIILYFSRWMPLASAAS